jgi:mitochondrial intermediate peptidase
MDLTLFGEQASKPMDTVSTVADLKQRHTSWKHVEGTHWHTRFTHLINYGAGKRLCCPLVPHDFPFITYHRN